MQTQACKPVDEAEYRALMEGVKLYLTKERSDFYPDVMVTCEPRLLELDAQAQVGDSPALVVEVLSPTTEGIDRREQLRACRTLPGLKEYAMVSQDECRIELARRRGDIGWGIIPFEPGDTVQRAGVELKLPIADVYFEAGVACSVSADPPPGPAHPRPPRDTAGGHGVSGKRSHPGQAMSK